MFLPFVEAKNAAAVVDNSMIQHDEGKAVLVLALVASAAVYRRPNGGGWWW